MTVAQTGVYLGKKFFFQKKCRECGVKYFSREIPEEQFDATMDNPGLSIEYKGNNIFLVLTSKCVCCADMLPTPKPVVKPMHIFESLIFAKDQKDYLAKFVPFIANMLESLYELNEEVVKLCVIDRYISRFEKIMDEMYLTRNQSNDDQVRSMIVCYDKLTKLKMSIWKYNLMKHDKAFALSYKLKSIEK